MRQRSFCVRLCHPSQYHPPSRLLRWGLMGAIALSPLLPRPVMAQLSNSQLPPPPNINFGNAPSVPRFNPENRSDQIDAYLVYVNGDSPLMLNQVQAVEPAALYRDHEGRTVIQVGVFQNESIAKEQLEQLEAQGIGATVDRIEASIRDLASPATNPSPLSARSRSTVPVQPTRSVNYEQPPMPVAAPAGAVSPTPTIPTNNRDRAPRDSEAHYFVIVPGRSAELAAIQAQIEILALDAPAENIQTADHRRGPHVRVGPFRDRDTANNWESYLRAFGLNARVHYQR